MMAALWSSDASSVISPACAWSGLQTSHTRVELPSVAARQDVDECAGLDVRVDAPRRGRALLSKVTHVDDDDIGWRSRMMAARLPADGSPATDVGHVSVHPDIVDEEVVQMDHPNRRKARAVVARLRVRVGTSRCRVPQATDQSMEEVLRPVEASRER